MVVRHTENSPRGLGGTVGNVLNPAREQMVEAGQIETYTAKTELSDNKRLEM